MLKYDSISELVEAAGNGKISELVLADQQRKYLRAWRIALM